ncbi:MAG: peptide chain release factor 2 [Patescibacteria group bacterium]|jgi:peptide chain release factor 2
MSHLDNRISALEERLQQAWDALRLEETRARSAEIEGIMGEASFWNDQKQARTISQEGSELKKELELWDGFKKDLTELDELVKLNEAEGDESMKKSADETLEKLEKQFSEMEFQMLLSGEFDTRNAILSFHAGAGGTDANDWVAMLLRMYSKFAEAHGWTVEVLDESRGEEAGFKSITIAIHGRFAYGWLRSEHGVHRLVRISPFDAEKMRHTTFALVEVLPEFGEVDEKAIELDPEDLRIDTFMAGGKGGQSVNTTYSAVRITHIPTNTVVTCQNERSQLQNRDTAMKVLKSRLYKLMVEARATKLSDVKGEHKTAAWGNQIRSYVLHPYKMVKDHRTDIETVEAESVLNGELKMFMEAYLRKSVEGRK